MPGQHNSCDTRVALAISQSQARSQTTPIKCTQLTIAITGGVTFLRMECKRMLRAEQAEILFVSPLKTFWGSLVANEFKIV